MQKAVKAVGYGWKGWLPGVACLLWSGWSSTAATLRWTGASPVNANWSRGANWDTGNPPVDGDTLIFPAPAARMNNVNNIAGLNLAGIRFTGVTGGYTISGNAITLTNGLSANHLVGNNLVALDSIRLGEDLSVAVTELGSTLMVSSDIQLNGHDLNAEASNFAELDGVISGAGNVNKAGPGRVRVGGGSANTFAGEVRVNEGTLELNKTAGLAVPHRLIVGDGVGGAQSDIAKNIAGNQVNEVTVNASGFWDIGNQTEEVSDLVLNQGGDISTSASGLLRLGLGANVTTSASLLPFPDASRISGNLELLLGVHAFQVNEGLPGVSDGSELIVDATISGLGGISKEGNGDLSLSQANSFMAVVTVNGGELRISHPQALGSPLFGTVVNNDASLILQGDFDVVGESLTLHSTGHTGLLNDRPALSASGVESWAGNVVLLDPSSRIGVQSAGSLEISGVLSGAGGLVKEGDGLLRFSGLAANSYTGTTLIRSGTLELNKSGGMDAIVGPLIIGDGIGGANADRVHATAIGQIASTSAVTVGASGSLQVDSELIGSLAGSGSVIVDSSLSLGYDNTSTIFDGILSGPGMLVKQGTGVLTLNGNNTYTGVTTVANGQLVVNGRQLTTDVTVGSFVAFPILSGKGQVRRLATLADRGTVSPGPGIGVIKMSDLVLTANSHLALEVNGPTPGSGMDQLVATGSVDLGGAILDLVLNFSPTLGQSLVLIDNQSANPISGHFAGLNEGDKIVWNRIPFTLSYRGGDGNDVTLTASQSPFSLSEVRIEAGNGNGTVEPNECNHLFVGLMNETSAPLAISQVILDSATPGVAVTQQLSEYPVFGALGVRTNTTPFQFCTAPDFECGRNIDFNLTMTVNGTSRITFPFTIASGSAGTATSHDNPANLNLTDNGTTESKITVSGAPDHVGKVAVSLHITHPASGDLVLKLRSPSGREVHLASHLGGASDDYGSGCVLAAQRTTFDDSGATKIGAASSPFVGTFVPEEPLSAYIGENPNGDWTLVIDDTVSGDAGELRCWSLLLSPSECTDGGGVCQSCSPSITGSFARPGPTTSVRLVADGIASGCGTTKVCPGSTTGLTHGYRTHTVTNDGPETCLTVVLKSPCRSVNSRYHLAAYLGSFDPAAPCTNYLGDSGGSLLDSADAFSVPVPANATIVLVVNEQVLNPGCEEYTLTLYGLPCPGPTLEIAKSSTPGEGFIRWSTAYPGYELQRSVSVSGSGPSRFAPVSLPATVVNGEYSVTQPLSGAEGFFRLVKP